MPTEEGECALEITLFLPTERGGSPGTPSMSTEIKQEDVEGRAVEARGDVEHIRTIGAKAVAEENPWVSRIGRDFPSFKADAIGRIKLNDLSRKSECVWRASNRQARKDGITQEQDRRKHPRPEHGEKGDFKENHERSWGAREMRLRPHLTVLPGGMGCSGVINVIEALSEAARTIPWLSTPRRVAGFRFVTTTTCFPTRLAA